MARLHPFTILSLLREAQDPAESQGPVSVDGAPALVEVLRKELTRGGDESAVRIGLTPDAEGLVYVLAAPTKEDESILAAASRARVPTVAVLPAG